VAVADRVRLPLAVGLGSLERLDVCDGVCECVGCAVWLAVWLGAEDLERVAVDDGVTCLAKRASDCAASCCSCSRRGRQWARLMHRISEQGQSTSCGDWPSPLVVSALLLVRLWVIGRLFAPTSSAT
jgi:hypothetical protein